MAGRRSRCKKWKKKKSTSNKSNEQRCNAYKKMKKKKKARERKTPCKKLCRNNPSVQQHMLKERGKKIPRITASSHMRPDRTHLLVLPQMAKTYPESAVASTCIESFALIEVHDKLEKKKWRPVGLQYSNCMLQRENKKKKKKKSRYRNKSVAKQRKQDVKKNVGL